jgi:hypothetical protein
MMHDLLSKLPRIPAGACRHCGAEVSYFARSCANCGASNLPNPVVTISALVAVAMVGLVIALGWHMFFRGKVDVAGPPGEAAPGDQKAEGAESYGWLVQAMAECEEEAKRATDKLYFLIAPVARAPKNVMGWHPGRIGMIGETTELLPSTDAVIGLRNGALTLYREPLAFAVSDPATSTVFRWKPAAGVTVLTTRQTNAESLKLGFQLVEGKDVEWGLTIVLSKGTCYWIFPLIRPAARSG